MGELHTVLHEDTLSSESMFMMQTWLIWPSVLQIQTSLASVFWRWRRDEAHVKWTPLRLRGKATELTKTAGRRLHDSRNFRFALAKHFSQLSLCSPLLNTTVIVSTRSIVFMVSMLWLSFRSAVLLLSELVLLSLLLLPDTAPFGTCCEDVRDCWCCIKLGLELLSMPVMPSELVSFSCRRMLMVTSRKLSSRL